MGTATTLRQHFQRSVGLTPDGYRRAFHQSPVAAIMPSDSIGIEERHAELL
jgi:methylphosphotriester-DNA--protein-cysteine methyltransferase